MGFRGNFAKTKAAFLQKVQNRQHLRISMVCNFAVLFWKHHAKKLLLGLCFNGNFCLRPALNIGLINLPKPYL